MCERAERSGREGMKWALRLSMYPPCIMLSRAATSEGVAMSWSQDSAVHAAHKRMSKVNGNISDSMTCMKSTSRILILEI